MKNDQLNIQMRLANISEVSFSMFPEKYNAQSGTSNLQIGFSCEIDPLMDSEEISFVFGTQLVQDSQILLESKYRFVFDVLDLKSYINIDENNHIQIKHLMPHFMSVAVGTMRGIIVVKTAGTVLSAFPIPMVNIETLLNGLSNLKK